MLDRRRARFRARACCPACAASTRGRRRSYARRPRRAWIGILVALAALVPLAAREETGAEATAAAAGASGGGAAAAPAVEAAISPPPRRRPTVSVEEEEAIQEIPLRESIAHGMPHAGWLENGVLLPVRGAGYYTYDPRTQRPPGAADRRYGTALLVREIVELGRWWAVLHPGAPRLGVGDLSRPDGGPFRDAHVSHQNGLDVDIRLPRRDGSEGRAGPATYDRALTQALVDRLVSRGARLVLVGPSLDVRGPAGIVVRWPNHDDHLHVRWPDPDGTGN
jgi:hypothetical protein